MNMRIKSFVRRVVKRALEPLFKTPSFQRNINLQLVPTVEKKRQKRVLISYVSLNDIDFKRAIHPNVFHINQMIQYFIKNDYCVDLCWHNDMNAYKTFIGEQYDVIIGFGKVYKQFCSNTEIKKRICFITENHPVTVLSNYSERVEYFHQRHKEVPEKLSFPRTDNFDDKMFRMSTEGILMSSEFNAKNFQKDFNHLFLINANATINPSYFFDKVYVLNTVEQCRYNLLWFGSSGLIHKGLDILIDAIKEMPEYELHCYGIQDNEVKLYNKLKSPNVTNCGSINVMSKQFINDVINKHNFMVFPSCSEGMSTAVATVMAHGIIPIVTRECGFNNISCVIEIENVEVETLKSLLLDVTKWPAEKIVDMRYNCYHYARDNYSLEHFDRQFGEIMDNILN